MRIRTSVVLWELISLAWSYRYKSNKYQFIAIVEKWKMEKGKICWNNRKLKYIMGSNLKETTQRRFI